MLQFLPLRNKLSRVTFSPHLKTMSDFTKLPLRQMGKNGPPLPRLGLGLMGASGTYGVAASDKERFALLDEAYKRGEIFWDTGSSSPYDFLSKANFTS